MKQKVLSIKFESSKGEVPSMTKCPASPDMVIAALQFLDTDCKLTVTLKEKDIPSAVR